MKRVGIFAGVFNPVHSGHITAALQAIEIAALDEVVLLPERRSKLKTGIEHFGHRVAMLNRAVRPHLKLSVVELTDTSFTVNRTLAQIERLFPGSEIVFLWGSDKVDLIPDWPNSQKLLAKTEQIFLVRAEHKQNYIAETVSKWPVQPKELYVFDSFAGRVSSSNVRDALRHRRHQQQGVLASVVRYSNQHWLYASVNTPDRTDYSNI